MYHVDRTGLAKTWLPGLKLFYDYFFLETDDLILLREFCEIPPGAEYILTEPGESFLSVFDCMKVWGDRNLYDLKN